jgi:hypothetical protein
MFNWLMNHVFDRQGYRDWQAELYRFEENKRMVADLDRRIRESFTPEEWNETEARCMKRLADMGY